MKRFKVTICRTSYAFHTFEIVAGNAKDAKDEALSIAGNFEFTEKDADYSVDNIDKGVRTLPCELCGKPCQASLAHRHQGQWIGDECCWDERLRASE